MSNTILAVLAHPDDESFGLGGTLALYASKGYDTYYVCATRGEVGTVDEEHLDGFKDIAELRTDELNRAAKVLGLKGVFLLGYRDSGMPGSEDNKHPDAQINHSIDEVAGKIVKYIRVLKPEHLHGYKDTAELRADELKRAAQILGLKGVFLLGYRDSGMPGSEDNKHPDAQINHSINEVSGKIVKYIRELKPDVVLTFD